MRYLAIFFLLWLSAVSATAQTAKDETKLAANLKQYFANYKPKGTRLTQQPRMLGYQLDNQAKTLTITADEFFAAQEFTPDVTERIYKKINSAIPKVFRDYRVTVITNGMTIDELIPNRLSQNSSGTIRSVSPVLSITPPGGLCKRPRKSNGASI